MIRIDEYLHPIGAACIATGVFVVAASSTFAQEPAAVAETDTTPSPGHGVLLTGYGTAGWGVDFVDDQKPNDFSTSFSPVMLFQITDRFLFESELEFELEQGVTRTGLEYAQIDYSPTNNLKVVVGKFLLPFNVFSERLHPSWINKFASPPPLYGHGAGSGPAPPLLPVLSDVGVQLRGAFDVGRFSYVTADIFASQGPSVMVEGEHDEEGDGDIPEVVFGENFGDNNAGKMFGGRVGFGIAPRFEANASVMAGDYDEAGRLRFSALGAHVEGRALGAELHVEWIRTAQQVAGDEHEGAGVATLVRSGYVVQVARRLGQWEPVARWGQIVPGRLRSQVRVESGEQLGLGLVYWFGPTLAVKTEWLMNFEEADVRNNRLALQWAFGF